MRLIGFRFTTRQDRAFGVGEFFVASVVAAIVDQLLGGSQVGFGRFPRIWLTQTTLYQKDLTRLSEGGAQLKLN
jgi:hypothetical protein